MNLFISPLSPAKRIAPTHFMWTGLLALLLSVTGFATAGAPIAQTFFVPFPETDFQTSLKAIDTTGTAVGNSLKTVISIVVPTAGTVITYDQWEDGYEADPANPTQSSTQVWGDGDPTNGSAPGYPSDILPAGAVITLSNNVAMPRSAATLFYDGRDRISSTQAVGVTRAGWGIVPGTVLGSAAEVYDTRKWGTSFKIPVGTNSTAQQQFSYSSLHIIASQNGTVVQVDKDGNGTIDQTQTLNLGDSMFVNGGILAGATVTASHPVEVHELTGRIGSTYQSRTFAIRPTALWSSSYYAPATTTLASEVHNLFAYNPGAAAITVSYETETGTGTFSVPANGNYQFPMPMNSGAHLFTASGASFYAVGANDSGASASANQTHDWGYALLPESALTTSVVTGWAPGSDDLKAPPKPDVNGSPVWVTPNANTTVYVNYAGDLTVGANTAPDGSKYDVSYTLKKLQTQTVYNATTNDMTKSRLFTTDGTKIATCWGEDSSTAPAGSPGLDMGTTIIPFPQPIFNKTAKLVNDLNSDGLIGTGDTVQYTLTLLNDGVVDLPNAVIEDAVPAGTTYVAGSTTLNGSAYPDDTAPATIYPLDNGGLTLPAVPAGNQIVITFNVTINAGATNVTNTASASSGGLPIPLSATVGFSVLTAPSPPAPTVTFTNVSGSPVSSYAPGANIYVTVNNPNANTDPTTAQTVTAVITDATTGDQELVTLTETGVNTGIFSSTSALPSSISAGITQGDGTLYAHPGDTLTVTHTDPVYGAVATNTAIVSVPSQTKYLYLSDPSQALDRVDPVAANDTTTASTATLGGSSTGTVTVASTSAAFTSSTATSSAPLTFSYTAGTGTNRLLVVTIAGGASAVTSITSVTYGGQTMALEIGTSASGDTNAQSFIYTLNEAGIAAATSTTVTITPNSSSAISIAAGATTFAGVNQTTPMGTPISNYIKDVTSIGTGSAVNSATGELIVATAALEETASGQSNSTTAPTPAPVANLWKYNTNGTVKATGSAYTFAGGSSVTPTFTNSAANRCAICAVSLKPATVSAPSTATFTQAPAMATAFTMPAATTIGVTAYTSIISGSIPGSPTISAVIKKGTTYAGATTVATITNPTYNSGTGTLTWTSAALGSAVTVNVGEFIYLDITTTQSGVTFQIQYDSTTKPSKISLPTNTVIQIPSYGLYDAAYPAGNLITSMDAGKTLYARASVTDPFGTYDVSSLNVLISNAGGTVQTATLTSAVSDNGTTKIFEYPWMTVSTQGAYTVQVTANEGTEGINATATLPLQVTATDLGTPSTTTFTDSSGNHLTTYSTSGPVYVQVVDYDQNMDPTTAETVTAIITTANGDKETVTLTETGINTGIFRSGPITTNTSAVVQGNGALNVVAGTSLNVTYTDPNDGSDVSSDNASIPAAPGVATASVFKTLVSPASGSTLVGGTVTYNIQVSNPGSITLSTVSVSDTFPAANLQYVSATTTPTTTGSGTLSWSNVGPLIANQTVNIQVTFTALTAGATVTNSASVGGTATAGPSTASVTINNPQVGVTKTVLTPASGPAYVGDNMTYRIVVQNTGSTILSTVPLQDQFPGASLQYVSATVPADSSGYGSLLWNNVGPIAVSGSKTIDVTFKVLAAATLANNTAPVLYAVDSLGNSVPGAQSTASLQFVAFNLSGHVYDDANGLTDSTVNGVGTNAGGTLYANLLDPNTNNVLQTTTVAADGSYSFSSLSHNTSYSVLLSTFQGTIGSFTPAAILPSGWVNTGENLGSGSGNDGLVDGVLSVAVASADVTNANFGIEQTPTANPVTASSQPNPGNTNQIAVPTLGGTDPEDPSLTKVIIQTLPSNGTLYYNGSAVTAGQTISGYNPALLTLDPANGSITVSFTYSVVDAANEASPAATVSMSFAAVGISGNAFNDTNALTDGIVNGSGTNAGGPLYVILVSGGNVVRSATVSAGGAYSFGTVAPNSSYSLVLSTTTGTVGNPPPAANLPAGWMSTGENSGAGAGNDGTVDGTLAVAVATSSVTNANFGIWQVGTLTGHLYIDTNGNGTQDGEPNLPNVNVVITDHDGVAQTVVSDANGNWSAIVPVGSASIHVDHTDPDFPAGATQTQGSEPTLATSVFNTVTPTSNDGYYIPATISGVLYIDTNGNGTHDAGEPALANVDVDITDSNGDPVIATSDASGHWSASVPPGSTLFSVDQTDPDFISAVPTGFVQTEGTSPSILTAVANVTTNAGNDGYFIPATVTGHLYLDTNGNGAQDAGEPSLANDQVLITDSNGINQTVTTDFNGNWSATVPPGATTVAVNTTYAHFTLNVPAGFVQTEGVASIVVTAVANATTSAGNDGYFVPAFVSGHLFIDTNGNGTQDAGEPSLQNVNVVITDSNGHQQTLSSNVSGNWTATVPPGSTTAKVNTADPNLPAGAVLSAGTDPITVTAVANTGIFTTNDGYFVPATVTGHLYIDTNGNGTQDAGEPNLPNVDVVITDANGNHQTVSTNPNGNWTASVPPGSTTAKVNTADPDFIAAVPAGHAQTQGTDPITVTAVANVSTSAGNDGYFIPATVTGHLFIDTNGNGVQDAGEPNISNVGVVITDANNNQQTVTTDGSGNWTASVPPGSTTAKVNTADPHFPAGAVQTAGADPVTITAVANTSTVASNDGYFIPAVVTGHLYVDTNGNGTQDAGEPNLPNVDVVVTDSGGHQQTVSTNANGNWTAVVPPGSTTAKVSTSDADFIAAVPAGYVETDGTDPSTVNAVANATTSAGNDGYFIPATVTGHLFIDTNGNGIQDAGEPNLANVGVLVTDANSNQQTVTTDAGGNWTASVPPGSTTAQVNTADPHFPAGGVLSTGTDPVTVTAVPNASTFTTNDGYFIPALINGHLYVDTNGNGTQDIGEPNLGSVGVTITDSNNNQQTVTTNANGNWSASVPPGTTIAKVNVADPNFTSVVPAGYVETEGNDPTSFTAVANANTFGGNDGYYIPATVTGHLYIDSNGNGTQDAGEPSIANVGVTVTDSNGHQQTVTTNGSGNWTASVPPGSTTAKVNTTDPNFTSVVPAGYTQTQGTDPATVTAVANTTTSAGTDGYHVTALYVIAGQVQFDSQHNGNFQSNDPGLPGFTVTLYSNPTGSSVFDPATDVLLATQVTDGSGNYSFTGYPNGNYIVVETPPNSALIKINDKDGNNDRTVPLAVSGSSSTQNNFLEWADPQGWFYDTDTGAVLPGGSISIVSVPAGGSVDVVLDGTSGQYSWLTNSVAGTYTMAITPPPGYTLDPSRPASATPLDPLGQPNPYQVGSNVNIAGTDLQDFSAAANPWYLSFNLQPSDPAVQYNNIPLLRTGCPVSFGGWQTRHPLGGQNGLTDDPSGSIYNNLEDFAFCFDPTTGVNPVCPLEVVVNANGTIDAVARRVAGIVGVTYELQYISDLSLSGANDAGWTTITTISPVVVTNPDGTETDTYQNLAQIPALSSGQGFVREKITDSGSGTVARTITSGWSTRTLTIGCQSCGDPFLPCQVFSGKVDAVSGSTLNVATSAGAGSVVAQFVAGKQYYVEVISGNNTGHRWEVDETSSTATGIAIDLASALNTQATLPGNLAGDQLMVREHITFNEVFPPSKFHGTNAAVSADRILFSAPGTGGFTIYWLFANGGSPKWVNTGDATLADVGGHIFDNCQGVYIHPRNNPVNLVLSGHVRQNAAACPLLTGATMISSAWPMDQSTDSRAMTIANGFTGNGNPKLADRIVFWTGDDTSNAEAYASHFLLNASGHQYWTEMSDAALNNEDALPLFKALRAHFIQSIAGKSNWVMPLPWTP